MDTETAKKIAEQYGVPLSPENISRIMSQSGSESAILGRSMGLQGGGGQEGYDDSILKSKLDKFEKDTGKNTITRANLPELTDAEAPKKGAAPIAQKPMQGPPSPSTEPFGTGAGGNDANVRHGAGAGAGNNSALDWLSALLAGGMGGAALHYLLPSDGVRNSVTGKPMPQSNVPIDGGIAQRQANGYSDLANQGLSKSQAEGYAKLAEERGLTPTTNSVGKSIPPSQRPPMAPTGMEPPLPNIKTPPVMNETPRDPAASYTPQNKELPKPGPMSMPAPDNGIPLNAPETKGYVAPMTGMPTNAPETKGYVSPMIGMPPNPDSVAPPQSPYGGKPINLLDEFIKFGRSARGIRR